MGLAKMLLLTILISFSVFASGDLESESHGAFSPHEKRVHPKDHYKDGQHNQEFDHEAVLGSRKQAEEFDQLPPEEAKKRLRVLSKKMDINQDGSVDREELATWIERSLKQLDKEEVEERFDEVDADHDGKIVWDEYQKDAFGDDLESRDADGNPTIDNDDMKLMAEDKRYFEAADLDHDGILSKEEFAAFQNPEGFEHMYDAVYENTMKDKDKDGDGFINLPEFLGEYSSKDNEWYTVEKDRFEHDYDKNKDGKLDKEEMKHWLIPDVRETALDEVQHLFNNADKNKDEALSYDEIADSHELFVGSEATNYGEHLQNLRHEEL